jgi:hypothetical protein
MRLSCRRFKDNQVRLRLCALAYDLANPLRQPASGKFGFKHLWMLKAAQDEPSRDQSLVETAKAS